MSELGKARERLGLPPDTPIIYDITVNDYRKMTQRDVDEFGCCVLAFGMLRNGLQALLDEALAVARDQKPSFDAARRIRGEL